jgi:hypothetical protein
VRRPQVVTESLAIRRLTPHVRRKFIELNAPEQDRGPRAIRLD